MSRSSCSFAAIMQMNNAALSLVRQGQHARANRLLQTAMDCLKTELAQPAEDTTVGGMQQSPGTASLQVVMSIPLPPYPPRVGATPPGFTATETNTNLPIRYVNNNDHSDSRMETPVANEQYNCEDFNSVPHGFFNRAFAVAPEDTATGGRRDPFAASVSGTVASATSEELVILIVILLFNTGLIYHREGIATHADRLSTTNYQVSRENNPLLKALVLYDKAIQVAESVDWSKSNSSDTFHLSTLLAVPYMALCINKAHISGEAFLNREQRSHAVHKFSETFRALGPAKNILTPEESAFFFIESWFVSVGWNHFAGAA
jgi:hypothetical protein